MINPAIALLCLTTYSFIVSFSDLNIFFVFPVLFLIFLNKTQIWQILKHLIFLNFFIVILALFVYFEDSFNSAISLFLRVNLIIFFNLLLFFNSKGLDIVRGFELLKFPKVFVSTLYFTIKMILDLTMELKNIKKSLIARNFNPKTNFFTYQTYGNIFGLLFFKVVMKSSNLKDSLIARDFRGDIFLSSTFVISKYDIFLIILTLFTLSFRIFW